MKNIEAACMDIRGFAEMVSRAVSEELGEDCQVKLQEVIKNNGVILQGLVILTRESNLSPTIYLNSFLEEFGAGMPLAGIVEKILDIYHRDMPRRNVNMDFFREFEKVKGGICYRIVNHDRNRGLLERIPHIDFLDLSICFFYAYQNEMLGYGSILIYNSHMEMWNCNTEMLMKLAKENTRRIYPWEVTHMEDMIGELLPQAKERERGLSENRGERDMQMPMKILSNTRRVYGAACMIYPELLDKLAQKESDDLYIIPSSVHELIFMPDRAVGEPQYLCGIVREVNATQVEPEEVLSDHLYHYKRLEKRIEIV